MKKYLFIVLVATGLFLAAHTTLAACDPISGTGTGMTGPLVQSMTWAFDDLDQNGLKITTVAYPGRNCDTGDWYMTIRSDISTLSVSKTYTKTNPGGSLPKTDVSTLDIQILPNGTYPLTVTVSSSYGASVTNTYQITIARAVPGQVIKQNQGQCSSSVDPFVASFVPPLCPFVDGNPPYQPTPTNISEGATITTRIDNAPVPNAIVSDLDTVLFTVSTGNLSSGGHIINAKRTISFNCGSIHYSGFRTAQGIFSCPLQTGTIQFKAETNDIPAIPVSGIVAHVVPNVGNLPSTDSNGNSSKSDVPSETYRVSDAVPEIKIINGSEYIRDSLSSDFNPKLLPSGGTIQFLAKYKKKVVTPSPSPSFSCAITTPSSSPHLVENSIPFSASASGGTGSYSYVWSFGDGTSASGQNVSHTYPVSLANTTVTPTLTVTSGASSCTASSSLNLFAHQMRLDGKKKTSCSDPDSSAQYLSTQEAQSVSIKRVKPIGTDTVGLGTYDTIYRLGTYALSITTSPSGFSPCGITPSSLSYDSTTTFQTRTATAFFASGVTPSTSVPPTPTTTPLAPPSLSAIGECHRTYPSPQVQSYISWNPVSQATAYQLYEDRTWPLSNRELVPFPTTQTVLIDKNLSFNTSYDYFGKSLNQTQESDASSNVTITTPSSCPTPPPPIAPTLVIIPTSTLITVGESTSYIALYDPDGPSGDRYEDFDVTSLASWSALAPTIAQSMGQGMFLGLASGSSGIRATFSGLSALALLNVTGDGPDFLLTISPSVTTIVKPDTSTYTLTLTSLNDFGGTVTLSLSSLPANVTGIFTGGSSVSLSPNGTATKTLTLTASNQAPLGRSTFIVHGSSGTLFHDAHADVIIQDIVVPPPTFSCTLSATQSTPSTLTASISNGSGDYRCRFYYQDGSQPDMDFLSCPTRTHSYAQGTYAPYVEVIDDQTAQVISCATSLTIGGGGGSGPSCTLSATPGFGPAPFTTTFTLTPTGGSGTYPTLSITPGDGSPSHIGSPYLYTYSSEGTFTASASVTDSQGNTGTCTLPVVVNQTTGDSCTLTPRRSPIIYGQSTYLEWSCAQPQGKLCTIDQNVMTTPTPPTQAPQSAKTAQLKTDTTFTLRCAQEGFADVTDQATVVVKGYLPILREVVPR